VTKSGFRCGGHVALWGEERLIQGFVGKPEVKRPCGRPRRRWKENVNIDFQELVFDSMYWIELSQDRNKWQALLNAIMNFRIS